eukprot:UN03776
MFYLQNGATVDACLSYCDDRGSCNAVNVVPLITPNNILDLPVNMPGGGTNISELPGKQRGSANCNLTNAGIDDIVNDETMVCYGFIPLEPEDPAFNIETEDLWYVRNDDWEDPNFYSTCYTSLEVRVFTGNPSCSACEPSVDNKAPEATKWNINSKCRQCSDIDR